jgi:methylamine dehydrogenase heavy chain
MVKRSVEVAAGDNGPGGRVGLWCRAAAAARHRSAARVLCSLAAACRLLLLVAAGLGGWSVPSQAELTQEPLGQVKALGAPSPHWILYFLFDGSPEFSKYVLFDADTLEYKAWITTGYIPSLTQSPDGRALYVADTFMEGPELRRKDVVSFYDTRDYSFSGKIEMPDNRRAMLGPQFRTATVHDGRFLLVLNFRPGTGISVIDTTERRVLRDLDTPGCSLLYPTGKRSVSMICGNGSLLTIEFDEKGEVAKQTRSEPFFDPDVDPVMENAAAIDGTWYFLSYAGYVHVVDLSGEQPAFRGRWSIAERAAKSSAKSPDSKARAAPAAKESGVDDGPWLPGGVQYVATHVTRGELYFLMHPVAMSGKYGHSFPGTEVWVFDAAAKSLKQRIPLKEMANTIFVTADSEPLMVTSGVSLLHGDTREKIPPAQQVMAPVSNIHVYEAATGKFLREAKELGMTYYFQGAPGSGGVR